MQNLFRFRELSEFDDKKRIDQNARRRKPQPEAIWFSSARPSSSFYGATSISKGLLKKHGSYLPTPCADELAILGAPMDPEDLTNQIMDGLDDDYKELPILHKRHLMHGVAPDQPPLITLLIPPLITLLIPPLPVPNIGVLPLPPLSGLPSPQTLVVGKSRVAIGWQFFSLLLHLFELRFAGKGLIVVREGISTPNAPYLRTLPGLHEQWWRVFPGATATGGAWVHAPPLENLKKQRCLERLLLLFNFLPAIYGSVAIQSAAEGRSIEMAGGVVEGSQSAERSSRERREGENRPGKRLKEEETESGGGLSLGFSRCRLCWGRRENRGGDGERRPGEEKEMGLRWIFEGRPVLKGSRFDSVLVVCY
ncbi:hypothetical protein D5086_033516 [Populus alba]|uniref:Uncharacterized protein n=1 Tax=Populus alba TaxID=43335 RepID=A0ACC4AH46_POPAL